MAVTQLRNTHYEGLSTDAKPTGVIGGSTFIETDTRALFISYDGTEWVVADERVRLTNESGTFVDIPGEFDDLIAAI